MIIFSLVYFPQLIFLVVAVISFGKSLLSLGWMLPLASLVYSSPSGGAAQEPFIRGCLGINGI